MELKPDEKFKFCPVNTSLEVSQYGNVRNKQNGEVLKQTVFKERYFTVEDPSKKRTFELVHRLVAFAWLNDDGKHKREFVHHKNGDGFDNRVDNLEWKKSCVHASLHGSQVFCDECDEKEGCEFRGLW